MNFGHGFSRGMHDMGRHGAGHDFEGWGRGGRHGFHPGGRDGRRRMFDGGELRLLLLALVEEQPRHGYDLIREIEERTGGGYAPSPGVVYPTLTMLDEMGHIDEVKEEGARKRFAITEAGRAHLAERREEADALLARLADMANVERRTGAAPIKRSMMGLGMAVREALASGRGRADMVHEVAEILDEAAHRIERLER